MQLRNQLLGYFFTLILAVLLIFGWNAYRFTHDSINQIEQNLGQAYIDRFVKLLGHEYRRDTSPEILADLLPRPGENNVVNSFLVDQNGNLVSGSTAQTPDWISHIAGSLKTAVPASSRQGLIHQDNHDYQWMRAAIDGTPFTLIAVRKQDSAVSNNLLQALSTRLLAIGLTVLWVAIWVALIISTVVSRKLNRQQQELVKLASHDRLTGLPNRYRARELLNKAIKQAAEKGGSVACIILDINRFKEINDALGHELGDQLLQTIAERLRNSLWQYDMVTRFGGDEFAMILKMSDENHITQVINKITDLSDDPLIINNSPLLVESTLGVATYPKDGGDADTIMRKAEVAMYSARKSGSTFDYYRPEHDPHSRQRLQLTAELQGAHEREELELHFQPQIDMGSGRIIGAEALCRWKHPQKGYVSPATFIPVAEETGIIGPMTIWVLRTSLSQCSEWIAQGHDLTVSVNLSARLLHDINLPGRIAQLLKEADFAARNLELEITETALMIDPALAVETLTLINNMGVRLSLDDFGSGYMSLSYLRNMPVDSIKIDMSFIRNMLIDEDDSTIVNTIIDLGHNLGCKVIAEGVENRDTYKALEKRKCDAVQGYYISQPLAPGDFSEWLTNYNTDRPSSSFKAD